MDDVKRHSLKTGIRDGTEYVLAADYDRLRRELAEARRDAARFDWFFGVADKRPFMKTYVDGIAAGYTVTQWRAAIDAALAEPKEVPK